MGVELFFWFWFDVILKSFPSDVETIQIVGIHCSRLCKNIFQDFFKMENTMRNVQFQFVGKFSPSEN